MMSFFNAVAWMIFGGSAFRIVLWIIAAWSYFAACGKDPRFAMIATLEFSPLFNGAAWFAISSAYLVLV